MTLLSEPFGGRRESTFVGQRQPVRYLDEQATDSRS